MERILFSYEGNDHREYGGVYCTETVNLPSRGKTHVFVLAPAKSDQPLIRQNAQSARSALHAVLADQSIPLDSEQVVVAVFSGEDDGPFITQVANSDFTVKDSGEIAWADRDPFYPRQVNEPRLAKCLADLLGQVLEDQQKHSNKD